MGRVDDFLKGLTPAELEEVRTKALFLLRRSGSRAADVPETLYDAIRDHLLSRGVSVQPYSVFRRKSKHRTTFDQVASTLREFTDQHLKPKTHLQRIQAYGVLLNAVTRRLQGQGIPLSLNTFLSTLPKAPSLLDLEFPGYLESGLLPQVLFRRKQA